MVSQFISTHQTSQSFRTDHLMQGMENTMSDELDIAEIREVNLTYLMLAQKLIRKDKVEAMFRLGLSEDGPHQA